MAAQKYVKFSTRILETTKDKVNKIALERKLQGTKFESTHDAIICAGVQVINKQKK